MCSVSVRYIVDDADEAVAFAVTSWPVESGSSGAVRWLGVPVQASQAAQLSTPA